MHPLKEILFGGGRQRGIVSVCTANPQVLLASMLHAKRNGYVLAIEATANQVNQFGGYTGMQPEDFVRMVETLRVQAQLPKAQLILGGDHLGPLTWCDRPEWQAMALAETLVQRFTLAGFTKIHLDTSMRLADDDPNAPLDVHVCARRGARLASCVETAYRQLRKTNPQAEKPVLIIGSEVPIPGGSQAHEDGVTPTAPEEFERQFSVFQETFAAQGLSMDDVVGFVVQPGVEFGDDFVCDYQPEKAASLCQSLQAHPGIVFEGHSTDYQTQECLSAMVRDGIKILKVGPGLTFALREAMLLLEQCEQQLTTPVSCPSQWRQTLLHLMDEDERYWKKYYSGSDAEILYKKIYSYSDRCRYYLPQPALTSATNALFEHTKNVPEALVSQYFPRQYEKVRNGTLSADGRSLVMDKVGDALDVYANACGVGKDA